MRPLSLIGTPLTYTAGIAASGGPLPTGGEVLIVTNMGANAVHMALDGTVATAAGATRSYVILPGSAQTMTLSVSNVTVSIITGTGTSDVQFQRGTGGF